MSTIESINQIFERCLREGVPAAVFIKGEAATGKTALLHTLRDGWTVSKAGHFILGQYSPVAQLVPYSAIITALRSLLTKILTENAADLQWLRQKILKSLGVTANILCTILPELECIVGIQNARGFTAEACSDNIFNEIVANFLGVLATPEKPLVLMLDDLQWMDTASANLLEFLLVKARVKYFMLVAAYQSTTLDLSKINSTHVYVENLQLPASDGVSASTLNTIQKNFNDLSQSAKDLSKLVACYGAEITLEDLSILMPNAAADVQLLIDNGFLKKIKGLLKFVDNNIRIIVENNIDTEEREHISRNVSDYFSSNRNLDEWPNLFYAVSYLNNCKGLIKTQSERLAYIQSNLSAGIKAKDIAANIIALDFFKNALTFIDAFTWKEHYQICFEVYKYCGISAFLVGNIEESEIMFNTALEYAETEMEKVDIYVMQISHYMFRSQFERAQQIAIQALELCGISLQEDEKDIGKAIEIEENKIKTGLENRFIEDLIHTPQMIDEYINAAMLVLFRRAVLSYVSGKLNLFTLCILKGVNLSLEYGKTDISASMFAWYGSFLVSKEKYAEAYEFAQLALNISNEYDYCRDKPQIYNMIAVFIIGYRRHLREGVALLRKGYQIGFQTGDVQPGIFNFGNIAVEMLAKGDRLETCLVQAQQAKELAKKYAVLSAVDITLGYVLMIKSLTGVSNICWLDEADFTKERWQRISKSNSLPFILHLRMQLKFWFGDYKAAQLAAQDAEKTLPMIAPYIMTADHYFYYALILLQQQPNHPVIEQCLSRLKIWTDNCPENFEHKYLLVLAEQARSNSDILLAMELYDKAIVSAQEHAFLHIQALANEMAAKFWLAQNKINFFRLYLMQALSLYHQWGAEAKVKMLESTYGFIGDEDSIIGKRARLSMSEITNSSSNEPSILESHQNVDELVNSLRKKHESITNSSKSFASALGRFIVNQDG